MTNQHHPECDPELHVGFTGTRQDMTYKQVMALREHLNTNDHIMYLHHGDCVGADEEAHWEAIYLGIRIMIHPPVYSYFRAFCYPIDTIDIASPYLERNQRIVDLTEYLIAAPRSVNEELRSGTWATIRYARKQGKEVVIIYPDGTEVHDEK